MRPQLTVSSNAVRTHRAWTCVVVDIVRSSMNPLLDGRCIPEAVFDPSGRRWWLGLCPLRIVLLRWCSQSVFLSLTSAMTLSPLQLKIKAASHQNSHWWSPVHVLGCCNDSMLHQSACGVLIHKHWRCLAWLIALVCSKQPENHGAHPFCTDVSMYWFVDVLMCRCTDLLLGMWAYVLRVQQRIFSPLHSAKRLFGSRSHVSIPSPWV